MATKNRPKSRTKVDPVVTALFSNALQGVADDAMLTLLRTSRSHLAKNAMDCSTGLLNARGELLSSGLGDPKHVSRMYTVMPAILGKYPRDTAMKPGDIYILNDPYHGGSHLPDIFLVKPVFHDKQVVAFTAAVVHVPDIGGRVPGGNASDSTEIFQEGLRMPPMKFFDQGVPDDALHTMIEANVRDPRMILGDIYGLVSACRIGEQGLLKLIDRHGIGKFRSLGDDLLDYTEEVTRAEYRRFSEGEYEFTDYIDGDGFDSGPITLHVKLINRDGHLTLDFTGTSLQVKGSINSTHCDTFHGVTMTIGTVLQSHIPMNEGFYRTIKLVIPPDNFLNVSHPGAVAARGLGLMRIQDVVWGALAKMMPDRVFACGVGMDTGVTIAGNRPDGTPFVYQEFLNVCWGGGPTMDGRDALSRPGLTHRNTPAEHIEAEQPLRIEEYCIVPNTGGAGKHRGGMSLGRAYRLTGAKEALIQMRTDRQRCMAYGLQDGKPGTPSRNILNPGPEEEIRPAKDRIPLKEGDLFYHMTAAGGGWGDPLERDPEHILRDLRNGRMTLDYVEREYGVIYDPETMEVDWTATKAARERIRRTQEARSREPAHIDGS